MNRKPSLCAAAVLAFSTPIASAQVVVFQDDFNDNTNTGWTYLARQGVDEIADAAWVETGGRLEQPVANYDFPRDPGGDPYLGAIALAPVEVGGHYAVSATLTSLEPGNEFQDECIVFGYVDADNFFYLETIPNRVTLFGVIAGEREAVVPAQTITFSHDPTVVTLEHNAGTGDVIVTYGAAVPLTFNAADFIMEGNGKVGVGSNNDAFATDAFSVSALGNPEAPFLITNIVRADGNVTITWNSIAGRTYFVERSTDLQVWDEIDDPLSTSGSSEYTDTNVPESDQVYYRVMTLEP